MNDREPPLKKMKKPFIKLTSNPSFFKFKPKPTSYLSLPDDLLLSCFARVSIFYYPTLSLVCKRFQSLLASPELYQVRSLLGCTESCLYVYLSLHPHSDPSWFVLYGKSYQTRTNNTMLSGYSCLAPIPIPHSPQGIGNSLVAIGSSIYAIGGPINKKVSSSRVSILDCRSHTWREAPSMNMERGHYATANVFDGKIYVAGGCENCDSSNWMEVFDPKTQTWELVLSTLAAEKLGNKIYNSGVIGEEIVMLGRNGNSVAYKPKEDRWEAIENDDMVEQAMMSSCEIDNVLYSYEGNTTKWYDSKTRYWNDVKGLESLPKFDDYHLIRLIECGGKMVVLWDVNSWCEVIAFEKRNNNNNQEIWGKIEWFDSVLTVPWSYNFLCAVVATI